MRKIKLLFLAVTVFFVVIVAVAMAVPQLTPIAPTFQAKNQAGASGCDRPEQKWSGNDAESGRFHAAR